MKKSFIRIALLAAATTALRADVHYSFNFDSVAPGSPASLFDSDPLSTAYAVFAPDVDGFGSDIPGTDRWRPDPSAPPVTVDNPTPFGSSTTSNPNALNAKFQPVLLSLAVPLSHIRFSIRLDGDPFGDSAARVLLLESGRYGRIVLPNPGVPIVLESREKGAGPVSETADPASRAVAFHCFPTDHGAICRRVGKARLGEWSSTDHRGQSPIPVPPFHRPDRSIRTRLRFGLAASSLVR